VACDFLAVYHLRINPQFGEFGDLTGYEFLRYASRLPVYRGAVANEVARVTQVAEPSTQGGTEMLPSDHPLFADLIDFG
jgi:hypothetical protein